MVSFSSQQRASASPARNMWTSVPPGAFFGGGGSCGRRTLAIKVRVTNFPGAVTMSTAIKWPASVRTVVFDAPCASPRVAVIR
jgi:hypothetical protein